MKNKSVRGSTTGRPIMVLLDLLGRKWTLRIFWELRDGPLKFRALQARCDEVSPSSLNKRLKELREVALIELTDEGYQLTGQGQSLALQMVDLSQWADQWTNRLDQ